MLGGNCSTLWMNAISPPIRCMPSPLAGLSDESAPMATRPFCAKIWKPLILAKSTLVLMSAGGTISKEWSPKIAAAGAIVVDNSSAWRMDPDVPLVVPEVNGEAVLDYGKKNIIANPNCSTAQLVVALKPLHQAAGIKRVVVSTYQSASWRRQSGHG